MSRRRTLSLEALEDRSVPATHTWIGATGGNWSAAANWDTGVPTSQEIAGTNIVFASGVTTNMDLSGLSVDRISFTGGNNTITLLNPLTVQNLNGSGNFGIRSSTGTNTITGSALNVVAAGGFITIDGGITTITSQLTGLPTGLTKSGTGTLALSNPANAFTTNIGVNAGTLAATARNNTANPTISPLGNPQTGGRTITVNAGATLAFGISDVFGNNTSTPVVAIVNSGTVTNTGNFSNAIGPLVLNGGTLSAVGGFNGGGNAIYRSWNLRGDVTVGGSAVSTISATGPNAGVHLGANTTFTVADATGTGSPDLVISAGLFDQSPDQFSAAGGFTKVGPGTLVLTGTNTYTGTTTISSGLLLIGLDGPTGTLGTGSVTNNGELGFARTNDVTVGNAITGTGRVTKFDASALTLTGANSYSGGTTIRNGAVVVTSGGAAGTGPIALGDAGSVPGAVPQFVASTGATIANSVTVANNPNITRAVLGASNLDDTQITFNGAVVINNPAATLELTGTTAANGTRFFGGISGSGSVAIRSNLFNNNTPGKLVVFNTTVAGGNTYAGTTTIRDGATLRDDSGLASGQLPDTTVVHFADAGSTLLVRGTGTPNQEIVAGLVSDAAGAGAILNDSGAAVLAFGTANPADAFTYSGSFSQAGSGNFALVRIGAGTQTLGGPVNAPGGVSVQTNGTQGRLLVNGTVTPTAQAAVLSPGDALGGTGTFQSAVTVSQGAAVLPGTPTVFGTLTVGGVTFAAGGVLGIKVSGPGAGQFDQLNVAGAATLSGATLFIPATGNVIPQGTAITILNNDGVDPIVGTFANIPEGGTVLALENTPYTVSYVGGDGNDVTLSPVPPAPPPPPPGQPLQPFLLVAGPGTGNGNFYSPANGQFGAPQQVPLIPGFGGELHVALGDVNGDRFLDSITGTGAGDSRVRVLSGADGSVLADFTAFPGYAGGVFVSSGDLNGDGLADIAVTPDAADAFSGPVNTQLPVKVYSGAGFGLLASFDGLASLNGASGQANGTKLGGRTAIADVNGDGLPDLLVSAGNGGGPRITIWSGTGFAGAAGGKPTTSPLANLFVFESSQRGGAFSAAGDVNGDGKAEIIAGGGPGGGPRVRIVNSAVLFGLGNLEGVNLDDPANLTNGLVMNNYFAGSDSSRGGVRVTVKDVDADGKADVVTGSGTGEASQVRVYTSTSLKGVAATSNEPANPQVFDPFGATLPGGVWVG